MYMRFYFSLLTILFPLSYTTQSKIAVPLNEKSLAPKKSNKRKRILERIVKMIINSLAFMNYPYRYKNMLYDIRFQIDNIRVGDYLKPENYPYVLSYKLLSFLNTDDFIIKYPFPAVYNCIYYKGTVFLNGKIVKYEDADSELEFVHEYYSTGKINESINEKCSSEEEYLEVMYAITDFRYRMTEQYNKDLIKMKNNQ